MKITEQMDESGSMEWRYYLNVVIRRRWWFMASAVLFWAGALAMSWILPPKFRSETMVLVDTGDVPAQYVTSNFSLDLQQRLQSMTEQTLSRSRLAQIVSDFKLYGTSEGTAPSEGQVRQMRGDISVELSRSNGGGEISAFKITYSGSTPEQAQQVTSRLASLFIQESTGGQQRVSEDTTSFLSSQLQEAEREMQGEESILRRLKSKNPANAPELREVNLQILSGLQDRMRLASESLHEAQRQKIYLGTLLGAPLTLTPGAASDDPAVATASPLDEQIEKMKTELADLSARYTPRHPDVVHLKEEIANAEKIRDETSRSAQSKEAGPGGNPQIARAQNITPLAQLRSQFNANEQEIANRKHEIEELEKQMGAYQTRLNSAPVVDQEIAEASRNYEASRGRYDSLLAKKEQSAMVTGLSKMQTTAGFRTVDPPSRPQLPYWPNRLKFSAFGLFLGSLVALLAILMKEGIDARIYGEDDLRRWVAAPVIATIPPLTTHAELKRHRRQQRFEIALASLLVALVPALTMFAYLKG